MTAQFTQTESPAQSAQVLADAVAQNLRDTLATQPRATLAVSGGKSPIAFFQALSQQDLDWARVNITLVDERIVPTAHVDSNTGLVRQHLLQNRAAAAQWLPLIDDAAVFVHIGATLDKTQELDAIGSLIRLKKLDVEEQSVRLIGTTAILLNKIRLTAVVNGETVTNPFVVTETWGQQDTAWRLAAMAYTRIIY